MARTATVAMNAPITAHHNWPCIPPIPSRGHAGSNRYRGSGVDPEDAGDRPVGYV